jgi:hypothetical protein
MWHPWGGGCVRGVWLGGPLRRPRRWWEDNIQIYLREIWTDGGNGIRLA